jgi:CBS domain-containing protein
MKENSMLVKEVISKNIFFCTPSDTAQAAARTMKNNGVGALPVVSDSVNRKLEGIITDRDLCCGVVAAAKLAEATKIADLMTRNPITCAPENTLEDCEELMQKHQIRRLPVIDKDARCIGMIAQADIALHAPATKAARTLLEISKPARVGRQARAAGA